MSKKKATFLQKILLLSFSFLLILGFLGLGELYFRLFSRINFLESSRGTFATGRYGKSYGNTPNYEGISFGEKFYTDANGFRYDPQFKPTASDDAPAVLLLGDSVLFGPAVTDDKTIAGNLRRDFANVKFYNAAAIGYDTFDYRNVVNDLFPQKTDAKTVYIVYCLNDLLPTSSQEIKEKIAVNPEEAPVEQSSSPLRIANDYLRSRSKFYLFLKNAMRDTQMIYFQNDLQNYRDDEVVKKGLQPLADAKNQLAANNVRLKVFVFPYEAQIRAGAAEDFLTPQKKLAEFFRQNAIDFYDATADFQNYAGNKNELFLYGDPMHLSAEGNKLAAEIIGRDLRQTVSAP